MSSSSSTWKGYLGLTDDAHGDRQSKLSQEQLVELQKSTHFDKKELQQWYKGAHTHPSFLPMPIHNFPPAPAVCFNTSRTQGPQGGRPSATPRPSDDPGFEFEVSCTRHWVEGHHGLTPAPCAAHRLPQGLSLGDAHQG